MDIENRKNRKSTRIEKVLYECRKTKFRTTIKTRNIKMINHNLRSRNDNGIIGRLEKEIKNELREQMIKYSKMRFVQ